MKIASSSIDMASSYSFEAQYQRSEQLTVWVDEVRPVSTGGQNTSAGIPTEEEDHQAYLVELSNQAKAAQQKANAENVEASKKADSIAKIELTEKDKLKIQLVEKMIEMFTGRKVKIKTPDNIRDIRNLSEYKKQQDSTAVEQNVETMSAEIRNHGNIRQLPQREGWGVAYDFHESYYEREQMSFSAEGVIKTADGQEISISVELSMSREFMQETSIRFRAGDAIDPLVINYNGKAAELTETKFSFDLDADGQEDQISFLRPGSGFLALDGNDDGIINNGNELFGPNSTNGFEALAKYDDDKNNWIDENDAVYNKLRIWSKDEQGQDSLIALGQQGIGAIYLGSAETQFAIKDANNTTQGEIQQTGIYLKEEGQVGIVQHVDITI